MLSGYLVLNTYKKSETSSKLDQDLHFWSETGRIAARQRSEAPWQAELGVDHGLALHHNLCFEWFHRGDILRSG